MKKPLAFLLSCWIVVVAGQRRSVRVHYGYFTEARPIHAACARGWFDFSTSNTDYTVICYPQTSGGFAVARLDSGQLDIANLGSTPMAEAAARSIPISAFYLSHFMGDSQGIYVRSSSNIETPFDLRDKSIGVPFGSTMHYQVLFLLDLFGLLGEVTVMNLSPTEIIQAWDEGSIDAAGCWGEAREHILRHGIEENEFIPPARTLMSSGVLADWGRPTFVVVAARLAFSAQHEEFMEHMVSVLAHINDSFLDNLGQRDQQNIVRWTTQGSPEQSFVPSMADALMKAGEIPSSPSLQFKNAQRQVLDLFIQHSVEELFSCELFGKDGCQNATQLQFDLKKTGDFLQAQKVIQTLGPLALIDRKGRSCSNPGAMPLGLCPEDILDHSWLAKISTTESFLPSLEQTQTRSFPANEIGRAAQGQVSTGDSTCDGHKKILLGQVLSYNIGDGANATSGLSYSDNLDCSWEVRSFDCETSTDTCQNSVILEFEAMRLWSGDFVRIYTDSNRDCTKESTNKVLLGQLSGLRNSSTLPPYITAQGCALIEFVSDGNQERSYGDPENLGDGFHIRASSSSSTCSSPTGCDCFENGDNIGWGGDCSLKDYCMGTSTVRVGHHGASRYIMSDANIKSFEEFESSTSQYLNDMDCTFHFEIEEGFKVQGDYIQVDIQYELEESYDLVYLQAGTNEHGSLSSYTVLTGSSGGQVETYYVPTDDRGAATLHFTTDAKGRSRGFFAQVRSVSRNAPAECPVGYGGSLCEIPRCSSKTLLSSQSDINLGRVVSQPPVSSVRAMPWAHYPDGGCVWQFEKENLLREAVGVRLHFDSELDLEPHPHSNIGDMLVVRSKSWDQTTSELRLFLEACDSNEACSLPWQTGICRTAEPRACSVSETVEMELPKESKSVEILLITDRNDDGRSYNGFDFLASVVDECPESGKACSEVKGASCVDGFCVCKGSRPCSCSCDKSSNKLRIGLVVGLVLLLFVVFVACFLRYRRKKIIQSRAQKAVILEKEAELEAFRNSVVGMRKANTEYVPTISLLNSIPEQPPKKRKSRTKKDTKKKAPNAVIWCWRETEFRMSVHGDDDVFGDRSDCWIKYSKEVADEMETSYYEQGRKGTFIPLSGYVVDFETMTQTKEATGFVREVQRIEQVDLGNPAKQASDEMVDLSDVQRGGEIPIDIADEPQMVLVVGDIIQISSQRDDGWAFGTKLLHSDDGRARDLAHAAKGDQSDETSEHILTDTGWFEMSATEIPTGDDLAQLQENVGDTDLLAAPDTWSSVTDPTVVELIRLEKNSDERKEVVNDFMSTLKAPQFSKKVTVARVHRIQNLAMWQSYVVKRETICYRETGNLSSEGSPAVGKEMKERVIKRFERKWLWHGTNSEVMDKIMQQGFNRSFCGKNATMYGKGVYFARDASYSAYPTYAVPDKDGYQYMMACRVVVGEYCRGKKDALTPDVRDPVTQSLFDSTVGLTSTDDMSNPSIYVTYHDAQAYPEYLIKFKQA